MLQFRTFQAVLYALTMLAFLALALEAFISSAFGV